MADNEFSSDAPASASGSGMSGSDARNESGNLGDRARDFAGSAKERLADMGSTARDRASHVKDQLADALESSAEKLRRRGVGPGGQLSAATSEGATALEHDGRMTEVATRVAGGMDATADWIRSADLDGLKSGIERQVKEHPGRTLLIAVGIGYLIGKAIRK
jgi:ElaB/YqjD/DUF883 family membrane-anchored ribosome-binding protein